MPEEEDKYVKYTGMLREAVYGLQEQDIHLEDIQDMVDEAYDEAKS
jgi:DNA-binding transcriptional regulator YhcF (GntR family)